MSISWFRKRIYHYFQESSASRKQTLYERISCPDRIKTESNERFSTYNRLFFSSSELATLSLSTTFRQFVIAAFYVEPCLVSTVITYEFAIAKGTKQVKMKFNKCLRCPPPNESKVWHGTTTIRFIQIFPFLEEVVPLCPIYTTSGGSRTNAVLIRNLVIGSTKLTFLKYHSSHSSQGCYARTPGIAADLLQE